MTPLTERLSSEPGEVAALAAPNLSAATHLPEDFAARLCSGAPRLGYWHRTVGVRLRGFRALATRVRSELEPAATPPRSPAAENGFTGFPSHGGPLR